MKKGRPSKPEYLKQDKKTSLMQQLAALEDSFKNQGYEGEYDDEIMPSVRAEVMPPPTPEKTNYNPDQIVDIVTFMEHPYFCNLKPYPWQRLILKCFYMGQEGNTNLEIQDVDQDVRESGTCDGCVWKYVRNDEEKVYKGRKDGKQLRNIFSVVNSPCLTCERFDDTLREDRYVAARHEATNPDDSRKIDNLIKRPISDNYETEYDLLHASEFDPLLRKQVLDKCTNRYKFQELILVLGRRSGKALALDTPVLTTKGWKTMGTLQVGDYVFGDDGFPTRIIAATEPMEGRICYRMRFSNGDTIVADEQHQWRVVSKRERKNQPRARIPRELRQEIKTTKEIAQTLLHGRSRTIVDCKTGKSRIMGAERNWSVELASPLQMPEADLPIAPYLMGAWLGDGCSTHGHITSNTIEVIDRIRETTSYNPWKQACNPFGYCIGKDANEVSFKERLRDLGLLGKGRKHIPTAYLLASEHQRLELLRGLVDTDGHVCARSGRIEITTVYDDLARGIHSLVCSLGQKATILTGDATLNGKFVSKKYRICFTPRNGLLPATLSYKRDRVSHAKKSDVGRIFIEKVEKLAESVPVRCIQVDNASNMFLAGKSLVPTHNSFLVSVMALYELYRLLAMGHPQARYGLMEFDEIVLLNVARNEEQAKKAIFSKIKQTVLASPFFQPYVGKDTELEMRFFTDHDKKENERRAENGINLFSGSLVLRCGSSNASGLVGLTCWSIIMDEVAAMAGDNPDSGLDYALYDDLKPSGATFGKDFKMMMLSNPKGPIGLLYDLHENRQDDPTTLVMRLATWLTNPSIDQEWLEEQKRKDPTEFQMQFGAEFGAASSDPMFTVDQVNGMWAMTSTTPRAEHGQPLIEYYAHLDPARTSDYYALVVSHAEQIYPIQIGPDNKPLKRVVIDHIHFWNPRTKNQPVSEKEVEDYLIELHQKFKFKQVSFDQWHSQSSIIRLKSMGINAVERQFNQEYKGKIYSELMQLIREQRIDIYGISGGTYQDAKGVVQDLNEIAEAKIQFTFLQKVWKGKRFEIKALSGYKDDICDAVAAAAYECLTARVLSSFPKSRVAWTGNR